MTEPQFFFSYAREDSKIVLRLARDLRLAGAVLWLDQLDIHGGERWDRAVEEALRSCSGVILALTPSALASDNVMDEVSYAIEKGKPVVPLLLHPCDPPLRLRRIQQIDFSAGYEEGFDRLLRTLRNEPTKANPHSASRPSARNSSTSPTREVRPKLNTAPSSGRAALPKSTVPSAKNVRRRPIGRAASALLGAGTGAVVALIEWSIDRSTLTSMEARAVFAFSILGGLFTALLIWRNRTAGFFALAGLGAGTFNPTLREHLIGEDIFWIALCLGGSVGAVAGAILGRIIRFGGPFLTSLFALRSNGRR